MNSIPFIEYALTFVALLVAIRTFPIGKKKSHM